MVNEKNAMGIKRFVYLKRARASREKKSMSQVGFCKSLTLAFLRPASDDKIMNRITACASAHGICHAELIFEGGQAFSIYHGQTPSLRARSMGNPGYELVTLSVSCSEYKSAYQFCQSTVAEQYAFDNVGMYLATVHPGGCLDKSSARVGKTFCSKIITEALQFADVAEVAGLSPSSTTPSRLYSAVKDSGRRICHTVRSLKSLDAMGTFKL